MPVPPSLRQLRYFLLLAETGHFGRAAERASITQPSLSLQMAELEERLGVALFERRRSGTVLTPEGRELRGRAQQVIEALDALVEAAARLETGEALHLRMGSTPTIGPYILPALVRRLRAEHPGARLVLNDAAPRELSESLVSGRVDLVLAQLPLPLRDVTVVRLFREPLLLAMPHDHPLAARDHVGDADLAGQDILSLSSAYALHAQVAELCRDTGAHIRSEYEGTSLDTLRQMVAMNMGLTFLPALYVRSEIAAPRGDVAVRPFRNGRFSRSVGLVWRRASNRSRSLERFAALVRATVQEEFADWVIREG